MESRDRIEDKFALMQVPRVWAHSENEPSILFTSCHFSSLVLFLHLGIAFLRQTQNTTAIHLPRLDAIFLEWLPPATRLRGRARKRLQQN